MFQPKPDIEFSSQEEICKLQEKKLQESLSYLKGHSPYYQRLFRDHSINIESVKTLADLQQIPVTGKEDLARYNDEFICVSPNKIIDYITTSGTIGDPVTLIMTDADLERLAYNEAISFACANGSENEIYQLMTTIDKRFMAGMAYFLGARKLGAGIVRVGAGIPELQWDTILRIHPTTLIAVPSFILKLIEYAEKNGIDYKNSSIKKAVCIGEALRNSDFSLNTLGQKIRDKWDIQLFSTYASTEMATAFTECEAGQGGHHHPELIIVEFLDDNNRTVPEGEAGEVTITTLGVEGMPLLRYKTGDVCRAHYDKCSCGRTTLRLGPVIGRKNQMIKYKGTTIFPNSIYDVLNGMPEIDAYILEVSTNDIGTDDILVKIALKEPVDEQFEKRLKDHFRASLRVAPSVHIMDQPELKRVQYPEMSRKPILFIDKRNERKS